MSNQFDNLLTPISQDSPCGDAHIYSRQLRDSFSSLRKPEKPDGEGDTNFRRTADWASVVELAESALSEQTKDIRIVCHLIEAWTQTRGFDGLQDGLSLLTAFIETCWDRSNPNIDDGDLDVRISPLENMLDDVDRGSCFPVSVRQIKLFGDDSHSCNFLEYIELLQSQDEEHSAQLTKTLNHTDPTWFAELAKHIDGSLEQLVALKEALSEKLCDEAPGLTYLREAIQDCQRVVNTNLSKIVGPEATTEQENSATATLGLNELPCESEDTEQKENKTAIGSPTQRVGLHSREEAYRQLAGVAEYLKKTEPHSPIPYLVGRAVELGKLPFPELVNQLIREEGILGELRREFGIVETAEDTADEVE